MPLGPALCVNYTSELKRIKKVLEKEEASLIF